MTPRKPEKRGLWAGINKVISGVKEIKVSLAAWGWVVALLFGSSVGGLGIDRSQGFPLTKKFLSPLISTNNTQSLQRMERKTDSILARQVGLEHKVDTLAGEVKSTRDTLDVLQRNQKKTQAVVERIAVLTKTNERIIREREKSRGLFGWGD